MPDKLTTWDVYREILAAHGWPAAIDFLREYHPAQRIPAWSEALDNDPGPCAEYEPMHDGYRLKGWAICG